MAKRKTAEQTEQTAIEETAAGTQNPAAEAPVTPAATAQSEPASVPTAPAMVAPTGQRQPGEAAPEQPLRKYATDPFTIDTDSLAGARLMGSGAYFDQSLGKYAFRAMQIRFDKKPPAEVLARMNNSVFKWNRDKQAWNFDLPADGRMQARIDGEKFFGEITAMLREAKGIGQDKAAFEPAPTPSRPMRNYVQLSPGPYMEDLAQVGTPGYAARAWQECRAYIQAIRRKLGPEPEGASLAVKSFPHELGDYREVVCYFDDAYPQSVDYAYRCERQAPETWEEVGMTPPAALRRGDRDRGR